MSLQLSQPLKRKRDELDTVSEQGFSAEPSQPRTKRIKPSILNRIKGSAMDVLKWLAPNKSRKSPSDPQNAPEPSTPLTTPDFAIPGTYPLETSPVRTKFNPMLQRTAVMQPGIAAYKWPPQKQQVQNRHIPLTKKRDEEKQWSSIGQELGIGSLSTFSRRGNYSTPVKQPSYFHPVSPQQTPHRRQGYPLPSVNFGRSGRKHDQLDRLQASQPGEQEDILRNSLIQRQIREIMKIENVNPKKNQVNGHLPMPEAARSVHELMEQCVDKARKEVEEEKEPAGREGANGVLSGGLKQSKKMIIRKREQAAEEDADEILARAFRDFKIAYPKYEKIQKAEEEDEREKKRRSKLQPKKDFIREPSQQAFDKVPSPQAIMRDPSHEVIKGRNPISHNDLSKVLPGLGGVAAWLNDNAVNGFFAAMCEAAKAKLADQRREAGKSIEDIIPRFHAFNTQWYPKMISKKGYDDVKMWAKRAKFPGATLLKLHKLFIPIHLGNHWVLLVIDPYKKTITVYDSMSSQVMTRRIQKAARDYLRHEVGDSWKEDEWTDVDGQSAQQANSHDCGVFTCFNALATFYGDPADLIPDHLDLADARKMMAAILVHGGFSGEFDLEEYYPGFSVELEE